MYHNFIWL